MQRLRRYSRSLVFALTHSKLVPLLIFVITLTGVLLSRVDTSTSAEAISHQNHWTQGRLEQWVPQKSAEIAQLTRRLPEPEPRSEIRGAWITNVDSEVLFDRDSMVDALQQLAGLNFNTVYPTVWNWGYTLHPSQVAKEAIGYAVDPRSVGLQGRDFLAEMVTEGHKRKLAVIPWFEFGFMTTAESELRSLHPDWITQRQDGTEVWMEGIYPRVWLNPFKPEVQQLIQDLMLELVSNYNIDGIQVDDHFGLPSEFGYDDFTVQLYQQEHRGKFPPANAQDPEWIRWRANKITAFTAQLFAAIKAKKRSVLFTLSPNNYRFSLNHSLQDWFTWERQGLIEELILQVYQTDPQAFSAELASREVQDARRHIPTAIGILTGLRDRTVPLEQIQAQVQTVRDQKFAGASFFFYETMWNLAADSISDVNEWQRQRQAGFQTMFTTIASRPNIMQDWRPQR